MSNVRKRRTADEISKATKLSKSALEALRASNMYPGFDYKETLAKLLTVYSMDEIRDFVKCVTDENEGSTGNISNISNDRSKPAHPLGEMIYILYVETFNRRPGDYEQQLVPRNKPPNRAFTKLNT